MTMSAHDPQDQFRQHLSARALRPATITAYTGWVRRLDAATDSDLLDLTAADLEAWIAAHDWKPNSHAKAVQAIQAFYRWARSVGLIEVDPAASLRPARVPRAVPSPCPERVWRDALDRASGDIYWRLRLAGDTGLRRAELAAVHPHDVVELPSGPALRVDGKGGKVRYVPLPADLAQWLSLQRGYIFPARSGRGPMRPASVGKWFTHALGEHPHALRHRYASRVYAATHDLEAVRELLGHSSVATTQGYIRVADDSLAQAARAGWDHAA